MEAISTITSKPAKYSYCLKTASIQCQPLWKLRSSIALLTRPSNQYPHATITTVIAYAIRQRTYRIIPFLVLHVLTETADITGSIITAMKAASRTNSQFPSITSARIQQSLASTHGNLVDRPPRYLAAHICPKPRRLK